MVPQSRAIKFDKVTFRRRTERLDWRKVASIDIDSLIHDGDANLLEEWIQPVTFCKADSEFDQDKLDPGFIKVFRLSQLISECLLASHEKCAEKLTKLEDKYNDTEKEKDKLFQEILHLKETLTSAKKELKKRKEMLASSQNEILGQNNADEYDQCPYCTKRFLTSNYLLAHIQRRHQGLPINPLYPSYHQPGATVAPNHYHHHPHHQALGNLSHHPSGSHVSRAMEHIPPMNQHQQPFPVIQTPSSLMYGINQLCPNNHSYSGSVVSLNQIPSNNINVADLTTGNLGFCRKDSFTQTALANTDIPDGNPRERFLEPKSPAVSLGLANDKAKLHQTQDQQSSGTTQKLQSSLDESNELRARFSENAGQPPPPPPDAVDRAGGFSYPNDGESSLVRSSKSRERVEAAELDVMRMQEEFESHWQNLAKKVRQSGIEELRGAMIPEVTEGQSFSINLSKEEDGEVPKSPIVNHTQPAGGGADGADLFQKQNEIEELKRMLQAAVHDELQSLVTRLESQEQFWQKRLASVENEHENQIQQLRQELHFQSRGVENNNLANPLENQVGNGITADKSQFEDGEGQEDLENAPPSGFILVGPKGRHKPNSWYQHQQHSTTSPSPSGGAPRDLLGESRIPIAKPRKSTEITAFHSGGTVGEDVDVTSSSAPSPIPTTVQRQPIIHLEQHHHTRGAAAAQIQSLSESEPEYLTIIQPEEFHVEKHDNSIPNLSTATANKKSQPFRTAPMSSGFPEMNKSGLLFKHKHESDSANTNAAAISSMKHVHPNEESHHHHNDLRNIVGERGDLKSDEVSDYTLSDSMDEGDDEQNNTRTVSFRTNDNNHHHYHESIDHPRRKSPAKQTPVKKKYIFDPKARKIVEVSPDDDDDDDDDEEDLEENYDRSGDLNNDDNGGGNGKKVRKSQLDLVRAKTIMELEQQMTDIGLNPESTAIGLEEMGRALRHLKVQRRASGSQIQDYEKFEEERTAVKTLAKFEATKSSIDGKLDAISTLSTNKAPQSSFVKIFSAVKTSGKNFRKRVASAVKKKPKSGDADDDEEKITKRKSTSAPPLKTTFFSKARWARRKKSERAAKKATENEKDVGENSSDVTTDESSEEIELPPFMTRSKTIPLNRRDSNESTDMHGGADVEDEYNSSRRKRARSHSSSKSRPKSGKPLKRLNSNNSNNNRPPTFASVPSNLFNVNNNGHDDVASPSPTQRNSSESPPFSNVDENENDYDSEYNSEKEVVEYLGNHHHQQQQSNQKQGQRAEQNKDSEMERHHQQKKAVINELSARFNGKTRSKTGDDGDRNHQLSTITPQRDGKKDLSSATSHNGESEAENWDNEDDDDDIVSFETSIRKRKNNFVNTPVSANNESDFDDVDDDEEADGNDEVQRMSPHPKTNSSTKGVSSGRWTERSMETGSNAGQTPSWDKISEDRLQEIKQMISKNKKEIESATSSSEDDDVGEEENPAKERTRSSQLKEQATGNNNRFQNHTRNDSQKPYDKMSQDRVASTSLTSTAAKTTPRTRPQTARRSLKLDFDANNDDELSHDDSSFRAETHTRTNDILVQGQQSRNDDDAAAKHPGSFETPSRKLNSSEEIEDDIRELLNTTMSDEELNDFKNRNSRSSRHSTSSFQRSNLARQQFSTIQPTQHDTNLGYRMGVANRGKPQDRGRKSPSNNSWDSPK